MTCPLATQGAQPSKVLPSLKHHQQGSHTGGFGDVDGHTEDEAASLPRIAPRPGMVEVRTPVSHDGRQAGRQAGLASRLISRVAGRRRAVRHKTQPPWASSFLSFVTRHSRGLVASIRHKAAAKSSIPCMPLDLVGSRLFLVLSCNRNLDPRCCAVGRLP